MLVKSCSLSRLFQLSGVLEPKIYFDNTVADMVGYYKARVFYTPPQSTPYDEPDPRINTIHWEPNISTDRNGEAKINFYNTTLTGNIRLVLEGATDNGIPVAAVTGYKVH